MTQLTDKELADPVYMRGYCEQSDVDFRELLLDNQRLRKVAHMALENLNGGYAVVPASAIHKALRKELAE